MQNFFSKYLFEIILFIIVIFLVSLLSIPVIFLAQKEPCLFSGIYSKRVLFFSIGNSFFITIILVFLAVFFTISIPDENAGLSMMFLVNLALKVGLSYGFLFPYLILFFMSKFFNK